MVRRSVGLYIHVPFCPAKCHYCDFNSFAGLDRLRGPYVRAAVREIRRAPAGLGAAEVDLAAETVNFGGGTPSLLDPTEVQAILEAARGHMAVANDAEISLEANPGTVAAARLAALRRIGVNRISYGIQSFDATLLARIGRIHSVEQALAARELARHAGFENVNLDFIYGLPGQSLATWRETLRRAIELAPEHLSAYALTIEPGTIFHLQRSRGILAPATEDEMADQYELATEMLGEAGYVHYEISNWARDERFACRHNLRYWRNQEYVGIGPGAHSWFGGARTIATRAPAAWIAQVEHGEATVEERETIPADLELGETAMLGLRLREGIDLSALRERLGPAVGRLAEPLNSLVEQGLVARSASRVALTDRGRLLGNEVFARVLTAARDPGPA
ncbi:MAG: radical SAM family heme chaperone HemW [Chloroflexi bacterium]|nr:radical SAM family heme chaperone HemW [Chloroflexota bacterium]